MNLEEIKLLIGYYGIDFKNINFHYYNEISKYDSNNQNSKEKLTSFLKKIIKSKDGVSKKLILGIFYFKLKFIV